VVADGVAGCVGAAEQADRENNPTIATKDEIITSVFKSLLFFTWTSLIKLNQKILYLHPLVEFILL
jgi:hypothetical protein